MHVGIFYSKVVKILVQRKYLLVTCEYICLTELYFKVLHNLNYKIEAK